MHDKINQAVILAGGLGTRLRPYTDDNPKPLYPINGIPFIGHLIKQIKTFGIENILLLLGYRPEKIMDYLGDGTKYGVHVDYKITPVEYDTGNRLSDALELLDGQFLLLYCDNYCPINYERLLDDFYSNHAWIQLSVYENKDAYTKDNVRIGEDGCVEIYDKSRTQTNLLGVDIGYALIKKEAVNLLHQISPNGKANNFEKIVYPELVRNRQLYATVTQHRYYSIGSWERIRLTEQFFNDKKTVFLDRDGTINERPPQACYVEKPEDFRWLPGAMAAIKLLKENHYRVILVTNQPGIARGRLTEETFRDINKKMQDELEKTVDCRLDAIYYCPHNWDDGCDCRKPKPGMLYHAQKDYSLNLTECIMIGDDERDMQAGQAAGCKCIQVSEKYSLLQAVNDLIGENR